MPSSGLSTLATQSATVPQDTSQHASDDDHDALSSQIETLGRTLNDLASQQHAERLLRMVRRPGWTTRQEAQLVGALVGHLNDQLGSLHRTHDALLSAADGIGRG